MRHGLRAGDRLTVDSRFRAALDGAVSVFLAVTDQTIEADVRVLSRVFGRIPIERSHRNGLVLLNGPIRSRVMILQGYHGSTRIDGSGVDNMGE